MARRPDKARRRRHSGRRPSAHSLDQRSGLRLLWGLVRIQVAPHDRTSVSLLWKLLEVNRYADGGWRLSLLWGLLRADTPPRQAELPLGGPGSSAASRVSHSSQVAARQPSSDTNSPTGDSDAPARNRAERQIDGLRKAFILGGIGLGFGALGAWSLTGLFVAIGAGVFVASFAERLLPKLLGHELAREERSGQARRLSHEEHARELQTLSASIAHEIRNPITAAKSLLQQMGEDPRSSENLEYAQVALGELDRVERSVSHLLRFAREVKLEAREFALADAIESALAALSERIKESKVELRTELDSRGRMIGDAEQLRRAVLNLVGNALDALSGAESEDPRILVELGDNLAGTEVWLRVSDNGPGIAPEEQARVFAPFHTSKGSGTGLGLSITKKIVEAHEGDIELTSALGAGTDFLLTFPKDSSRSL